MKAITKQPVKAISRLCLALGLALLASATMAASAQAIEITPDNTLVTATTDPTTSPTFTIAGWEVVCEEGTLDGTTGVGAPNIDLHPTFQTNCNVAGFISATVTCVGAITFSFNTTDGVGGGTGTVDLDPDFECTLTASSCHIEIKGPQDPTGDTNVFMAGADMLEWNVDVDANVISTCFGGPPTGIQPANIDATYTVTPTNLTIEAIEITPDNITVLFHSTDATLTLGGTTVSCDGSTLAGTTGQNSPTIETLSLTFEKCTLEGVLAATVACTGTATLTFTTTDGAGGGSGTFELNADFECTMTASSCHIEVKGPQDPTTDSNVFTAATTTLAVNVTLTADVIQTGFGCPTGTNLAADWSGAYVETTTPAITIDP